MRGAWTDQHIDDRPPPSASSPTPRSEPGQVGARLHRADLGRRAARSALRLAEGGQIERQRRAERRHPDTAEPPGERRNERTLLGRVGTGSARRALRLGGRERDREHPVLLALAHEQLPFERLVARRGEAEGVQAGVDHGRLPSRRVVCVSPSTATFTSTRSCSGRACAAMTTDGKIASTSPIQREQSCRISAGARGAHALLQAHPRRAQLAGVAGGLAPSPRRRCRPRLVLSSASASARKQGARRRRRARRREARWRARETRASDPSGLHVLRLQAFGLVVLRARRIPGEGRTAAS